MSQDAKVNKRRRTDNEPVSGGFRGAQQRLLLRWRQVVGLAAVLAAFVQFAGLYWQAGLAGVMLAILASALLPLTRAAQRGAAGAPGRGARRGNTPFDDILQALPHPAILLASGGAVIGYNAKAREYWDNLKRGTHLSSAIRQPLLLDAVSAVGGGAKPATVNYTERVPVERRIEATVASLPAARQADPEGPAILVSLRDLSEQERLNQMRADFVANASHELRTPLASLLGFIETLQGPARTDTEATDRFLGIMAAQAERMTRLIDDLLSLSRVEMNVHLQPTEIVDLGDVVAHVAESMTPVAKEAGIKLHIEVPVGKIPVRGERDELVQLTQNLVQNAVKYGRKKGKVRVSVTRLPGNGTRQDRVCLAVEDNGPGIAPEHLPRLTERFYRVDVTSSREKGGTGLGLAIVKHIVMRHRGDLQITSEPGDGSTFSVTLDEAGKEAREAAESSAPELILEMTES